MPIENLYDLLDETADVNDIIITKEMYNILINELKKMSVIYIDTFELKYNFYLSNKEISELLNISESTIRKRLQVVRGRLKSSMEEYLNGK